jgi:phosphate transport system protein
MSTRLEGHITRRYDAELNSAHLRVLEMGALVLNQLDATLNALQQWDASAARGVFEGDENVRRLEREIELEVVQLIAKRTPVARDLRAIIGMARAVADLGHVEGHIINVAEFVNRLFDQQTSNPPESLLKDISSMGRGAMERLHQALEIFDGAIVPAAQKCITARADTAVWFKSDLRRLTTFLMEDSRMVGLIIEVVLALRSLERIVEYSVSLCENVIYQVTGETALTADSAIESNRAVR